MKSSVKEAVSFNWSLLWPCKEATPTDLPSKPQPTAPKPVAKQEEGYESGEAQVSKLVLENPQMNAAALAQAIKNQGLVVKDPKVEEADSASSHPEVQRAMEKNWFHEAAKAFEGGPGSGRHKGGGKGPEKPEKPDGNKKSPDLGKEEMAKKAQAIGNQVASEINGSGLMNGMSYSVQAKLGDYSKSMSQDEKQKDGSIKTFHYPESHSLTILGADKAHYDIMNDGRIIPEGEDLKGKGITVKQLKDRTTAEIHGHKARIAAHK